MLVSERRSREPPTFSLPRNCSILSLNFLQNSFMPAFLSLMLWESVKSLPIDDLTVEGKKIYGYCGCLLISLSNEFYLYQRMEVMHHLVLDFRYFGLFSLHFEIPGLPVGIL